MNSHKIKTTLKNLFFGGLLAISAAFGPATTAQAAYTELESGTPWMTTGGAGTAGTGRGVSFRANSDFSIGSIGIYGNLKSQSFDVLIYSSTNGHNAGSVLASATAALISSGTHYYDIAINYGFTAGAYYTLLWRPTTLNNTWDYVMDYYLDSTLPKTIGPLTLIDGVEGYNANSFMNSLHPKLRLGEGVSTAVPEPAAAALIGVALAGLGAARRRKAA